MMAWLTVHWGTLLTAALLLAVVAGVVWVLRRDKKQGKSSCGGNCAGCAGCASRGACAARKE